MYLGFVSFFADISTEMMRPIVPIFITTVLGGSKLVLGFITGLAEALGYVLRFFAGTLASLTRKYWSLTFLGYGLSTISKPLTGIVPTWHYATITLSADRVGKAMRTPARDALLASSARKEKLGKIFGIHRFLDQLGAVLGPLITIILLGYFIVSYRTVFYITIVPGLVSLTILYFAYAKFKKKIVLEEKRFTKASFGEIRSLLPILPIVATFGLGYLHINFLLDRAQVGFSLMGFLIPSLYLISQLVHAFSGLFSGRLFDRIGVSTMYFSMVSLILVSILSYYTAFLLAIFLAFIFYGIQEGIHEVSWRALVGKIVPADARGFAYGIYHMIYGISILMGSLIIGYLYDYLGYFYVIFYVIILQIFAMILLSYLILKYKVQSL